MIKLENATLRVKKIRGSRNGDFCIADLSCEVGEFKVKDPMLDQFEDGEYQGTVWISEIYLSQYVAWGKGVTEIRARLHDLQIDGVHYGMSEEPMTEIDPVDEAPPPSVAKAVQARAPQPVQAPQPPQQPPPHSPAPAAAPTSAVESFKQKLAGLAAKKQPAKTSQTQIPTEDLRDLFGECYEAVAARQSVKLDVTVDRAKLRQQAAELTQLGFRFDPTKQVWNP